MKSFMLALMLVLNVASLAEVQTLASDVGTGTVTGKTYQLVDEDQRVGSDRQPVARSKDRLVFLNRTPGDYTPVSQAPAQVLPTSPKPTIDGGWMNCPCDADCNCVLEDICKNGDCKKNYVVQITAKWCRACPRMKLVAEQLRREGYIVYVVEYEDAREKLATMKITHVPTTLVFAEGKEIKRFVGVASIEDIRDGLKKKAEQPDKKPEPQNQYNFR